MSIRRLLFQCTKRWSSTRRISSSHWKLTCSRHDIAEKLLSWRYISPSSFNLTTDLPKITNRSMNDFTISRTFSVWLCRSLESSSLLLHFSGFWQYLFLQDGWYCASQANRSTPLILVSRCSSCFSCAILWSHTTIIFKPNGSFCRPTTLHFNFLFPFLFTKYTVWFEYYFVRIKRPTASTFKITTACNGLWRCWQKRLRFIVNFW